MGSPKASSPWPRHENKTAIRACELANWHCLHVYQGVAFIPPPEISWPDIVIAGKVILSFPVPEGEEKQ